jgi:DNA repair protein RadC
VNFANLEKLGKKPYMRTLKEAKVFCSGLFSDADVERFYIICLDAQSRVLNTVMLFTGTINEVAVYPREVVGQVIRLNAQRVVLAHNHPSGVLEPSQADLRITRQLREALASVDILLQDHIIYADGGCLSIMKWKKAKAQQQLGQPKPKVTDAKMPKINQSFSGAFRRTGKILAFRRDASI